MCLIIDANKAADFCHNNKSYMGPLWKWIYAGGRIVSGGKLEDELFKVEKIRPVLMELGRKGSIITYDRDLVDSTAKRVAPECASDDPHVVALAFLSRADLVVTEDKLLISDLKNRSLVGRRRRIYKENSASPNRIDRHIELLRASDCP